MKSRRIYSPNMAHIQHVTASIAVTLAKALLSGQLGSPLKPCLLSTGQLGQSSENENLLVSPLCRSFPTPLRMKPKLVTVSLHGQALPVTLPLLTLFPEHVPTSTPTPGLCTCFPSAWQTLGPDLHTASSS